MSLVLNDFVMENNNTVAIFSSKVKKYVITSGNRFIYVDRGQFLLTSYAKYATQYDCEQYAQTAIDRCFKDGYDKLKVVPVIVTEVIEMLPEDSKRFVIEHKRMFDKSSEVTTITRGIGDIDLADPFHPCA